MDRFQLSPLVMIPSRSRRTLLGTILAATGTASGVTAVAGKKKKRKKRCKAPSTKCGKKACCQAGEVCDNGQCQAASTTPPPSVTPLTPFVCAGPREASQTATARVAQTFAANGSGTIATATFDVSAIAVNTPFGVEIRTTQNGFPTSVVLGTAIVTGLPATSASDPITATATFVPAVPVTQGELYALVITDLARKGFFISTRISVACPTAFFVDSLADNQFVVTNGSLVYSINP